MNGEHFIPFRKADIVSMCADELPPDERESFLGFTRMLSSLLHHRFHERIEVLKDAYHNFNPEADTRTVAVLSPAERLAALQRLEEELAALARAANFTPIDPSELDRAFTEHSLLKVRLEVDHGVVDKILFFRRGESTRTRQVPTWFGLRRKTVAFTNYARVLVYATFKDANHFADTDIDRLPFRPGSTIIKLFQNVPRDDLEMVFPNVQVRMRRIDKLLIGVPALISGIIVIVTKLVTSFGLLLLLLAFWMGIRDEPVVLDQPALVSVGIGLVALGAYLVRQVSNFKNRKILFMKALSENLYFRNLDNDAGVFHHLLDAAEEAEAIEALLAYHFLRTAQEPLNAAELDRRIEKFFAQRWDERLDFEVEDGLRKLRQLSLVIEDEQGRLSAVTLADAKQCMDLEWDNLFDYNRRSEVVSPA
ncbi:MAG TPA: DUF3754 domain-containing protein [Micromonosporaceae bacterium]|nr:DUF3754 domain-containing protein [Micromonosporaceae bacterium]HCU49610.1 DUF3754 domain-containing protein [Micromonosporaceae bacterium]